MALSGPRVPKRTAESWWLFSGPRLAVTNRTAESRWAVTNRTAESWWLFLAKCRISVAFSGPRLAAANRTAESRWLFLAYVWP